MKIYLKFILLIALAIAVTTLMSCEKETPSEMEPDLDMEIDPIIDEPDQDTIPFLGEFNIDLHHISGIKTFYDSVGNIIFQGEDTTAIPNHTLIISEIDPTNDTLLITSLIRGFNGFEIEVKGIIENDTLQIIYDFSEPLLRNNYIRGDIWLNGDSIFLDYNWNTSDIWSAGALPERGTVEGKGI